MNARGASVPSRTAPRGEIQAQQDKQTHALLGLIEADRARQCAQILGEANDHAAALRAQAHAEALARMRQAFAEQRLLRQARIAAAQARLATRRRLHRQQRTGALLRLAWEQLPGELQALWEASDSRAAWVAHVQARALALMPPGGAWRIVHAPDWPVAERQALAQALVADAGTAPLFVADTAIGAGLKIVADGNVIDGTLAGLLEDRRGIEARLLRRQEGGA